MMRVPAAKLLRTYLSGAHYQAVKRILDGLICVATLPITAGIMLVVALAIRLESPGPALFVQERVGYRRRRFRLYKFRTMQHKYDDSAAREYMKAYIRGDVLSKEDSSAPMVYKPNHEAQLTRVGRVLRKTSLDELPQILNVLKGEMSLVGPRPHVVWEVEEYRDWQYDRLRVLPGVTGLAQVRGRSSIPFDHLVRYDLQYVEEQSLTLDIKIIYWTLRSVTRAYGAA